MFLLPRLYRLLRLAKLIRFYRSNQFIVRIMKAININPTTSSMINLLFIMIFILHFIGCIWVTVSEISYTSYPDNWMQDVNLMDKSSIDKYIASVYWAAETILTVGYGDITP